MVEVTQGVQKRWFKYDALGRLLRVRQPEQEVNASLNLADPYNTSGQWTAGFTYDVLGNVLTATDANGVTITNTYDNAGRVKTRIYSDSTPAVSFFYDGKGLAQQQTPNYAKGKLTKVTSSVSETRNAVFDNLGRLKESQQITDGNTYTSKYTYNFSGALIEEEYPSGRKVKNEFESDGDLLRVFGKANASAVERTYANSLSYTASGGISQMRLGNGRWETAKFNTRLQVTELGLGSSATDAGLWKVNYEYGELQTNGTVDTAKNTGNIAKQTLTIPGTSFVQSYRYDSLYRLTEVVEKTGTTQNWIQNWGYDRYGNRLSFTQNIAGNTNASNPTIDQNTNRFNANQGFSYDKNGNVVGDVDSVTSLTRQFVFNGDNKQTEVKKEGVTIGRYFYDGEGKRVKKVTDTETTVFVYSAGKLIAEYSTQLSQNPTTSYTTTDHLGSPRIITDTIGQVKSRRDFLPFGEDLFNGVGARTSALQYGSSADDIKQKFTGYLKDNETGLDFAEARMYENRLGRFTAVDPLLASGKSANPQSFNRFVYVGNNPILRFDPTGEDWIVAVYLEKVGKKDVEVKRPYWVPKDEVASDIPRALTIWEVNLGGSGFQALDPNRERASEVFRTREEAQAQLEKWIIQKPTPDVKLEVVVFDKPILLFPDARSIGFPTGHVAYGIDGKLKSWEWGGWSEETKAGQSFESYVEKNAQIRSGTVYQLDFGSPDRNQRFATGIRDGYKGREGGMGGGYHIFANNCGAAFCRTVNDMGFPRNRSIQPSEHGEYIESNLRQYIRSQVRFRPPPTPPLRNPNWER